MTPPLIVARHVSAEAILGTGKRLPRFARNDTPPCRCEGQQCRSNLFDGTGFLHNPLYPPYLKGDIEVQKRRLRMTPFFAFSRVKGYNKRHARHDY